MKKDGLYKSTCPYDCPDACGLIINIENGKIKNVAGDKAHSFTRGTLCPKMIHYEKIVHSPERITRPLRRVGKKGSGEFTPISWDEAITEIAERWQKIIAEHGSEALMPYSFAGTMGLVQISASRPLFYKLKASTQEHTICTAAKNAGSRAVMGDTLSMRPQELAQSDYVILWSSHTLATNIHTYHDVIAAKKKGAKIVVIDIFKSKTTKWADEVILTKPGIDGALAIGLALVWCDENLLDKDFIAKYVEGYEIWSQNILSHWNLEKVSQITGVAENIIKKLAREMAAARAPFIKLGSGNSRYGNGAMTVRLISILPALLGAWAKDGGGLFRSVKVGSFINTDLTVKSDWIDPQIRRINMNQIGRALTDKDKLLYGLFVQSSNLAATAPNQNLVLRGLAREDLFTVVHERFMTDTARYADIILPATTSLEHDDIYYSYGHYNIRAGYKLIEPVGEAKCNWDVMCLLAKAMGVQDELFHKTSADMVEAILASAKYEKVAENEYIGLSPDDIAAIKRGEAREVSLPVNFKLDFKTDTGKIKISNASEPQYLPDYMPPHGGSEKYCLINPPDERILDSSFNENYSGDYMKAYMHPADLAAEEINSGDKIKLQNERGEIEVTVISDDMVAGGTIVSPGIWWIRNAGGVRNVNVLTSCETTDRGGGSLFYDVKVNIKKCVKE